MKTNVSEQYLERFLFDAINRDRSAVEFILDNAILTMVTNPNFTPWLETNSVISNKGLFSDVSYAVDVVRKIYDHLIPDITTIEELNNSQVKRCYGKYLIEIDIQEKDEIIISLTDGVYSVILYNHSYD